MAKKFHWLKLKEDFFRNKKIKKLRRIAGGDTYTIIYLKMQLLSLINDGKLFYEGVEDSFIEELSLEIDEEVENVAVTVRYLMSNQLLVEVDESYTLPEVLSAIGSESSSAERVRKHRALKKNEEQKKLQCNTVVTNRNTEIEIELERELENKNICASNDANVSKPKSIKRKVENATVIIDKDDNVEIIDGIENEFNELWKKYPNKKGKSNALKSYRRHRKKTSYEEIKAGLENYINHIKINNIKPQFIKHGSTWFNQESWNDDYTLIKNTGNAIRDHWDNI